MCATWTIANTKFQDTLKCWPQKANLPENTPVQQNALFQLSLATVEDPPLFLFYYIWKLSQYWQPWCYKWLSKMIIYWQNMKLC